jgi:hypothetical protein
MARTIRRPALAPSNLGFQGRVQIKGLREYQEKLIALGDGMVGRGATYALAGGADVMRDAARRFVPVLQVPDPRRKPGVLRNAVVALRVRTDRFAAQFVVGIKLLGGKAVAAFKRKTGKASQANPDDPFYGPILEFGKTPRTRHPFMKPAFDRWAEQALRVAFDRLRTFTNDTIRRLGARA